MKLGAVQGTEVTDRAVIEANNQSERGIRHDLFAWWRKSDVSIPARSSWSRPLRMVHGFGLLITLGGFFGLAYWSSIIASRFSLTSDMALYNQAWFEIAHGHLNPYSSVYPPAFWHNAMELVMWLLAPLWYIWPHTVTLLWVQDAATAGCEAMLLIWMCELAAVAEQRESRLRTWIAVLPLSGFVILVVSPWILWINFFDFHPDAIALFFAIVAAHALWKGILRRGVAAAILTLTCGAIGATYVAGVGLSALLAGQRWRRVGIAFIGLGAFWLGFIWLIGADHATIAYLALAHATHAGTPTAFHLITAMFKHAGATLETLWSVRVDVIASLSGGAFIGLFSPWTVGISILVLMEGALTGSAQYIQPSVENSLPILMLVPFGTISLLIVFATSRRRVMRVGAVSFAALAVLNAIGWSVTWTPRTQAQWISIGAETAGTLSQTLAHTHTGDEVIASQGIIGRFAHRQYIYPLSIGPTDSFPVASKTIWFIVTPFVGIETESSIAAQIQLGQIAALPNAHLVTSSNGVYVFRWFPPRHVRSVSFVDRSEVPAWTLGTTVGHVIASGLIADWRITVQRASGLVAWGDYWRLHDGWYTASVRLTSLGPIKVQLWDNTTNKLLVTHTFSPTGEVVRNLTFHGTVVNGTSPMAFAGSGLFRVQPVEPMPGDILELRIVNPGDTSASIYSVGLVNEIRHLAAH